MPNLPRLVHQLFISHSDTRSGPDGDQPIQLVDFSATSRQRRGSDAALHKRSYLLDRPHEMKFSHSLQFNSVPDWADKYVAYSNLKKAIYNLEQDQDPEDIPGAAADRNDDIESESVNLLARSNNEADRTFVKLLDRELRRICDFYGVKEQEVRSELEKLQADIDIAEKEDVGPDSDEGDHSEDDEDDEEGGRSGVDHDDSPINTGKSKRVTRRGSMDALFADPRKYNEASREERLLRGFNNNRNDWSGASGSRPQQTTPGRKASDAAQALDSPLLPEGSNSAHNLLIPDESQQPTRSSRKRTTSSASQGPRPWSAFFKRRPSQRRSLGLVTNDGELLGGGGKVSSGRSEGEDSSFFGLGDNKPLSIWTAENDYAIDQRITFKRRITDLFVTFSELKQFVQLNETGLKKILKKYDKTLGSNLKDSYMEHVVLSRYAFRPETRRAVDENIELLTVSYAKVVTSGDVTMAVGQLQAHLREQVVWQRNTVWREMIGIERRAQGARLQETVMGKASQGGEKPTPTRIFGVTLPPWAGIPALQLAVAFTVLTLLLRAPGLRFFARVEEQNCLAMLVFCTILWATEVIPLFVTSLLVPFLVVTLRVGRSDDIEDRRLTAPEATKWIFSTMFTPSMCLLLGGFTIAAALSKYGIDKMLAQKVLRLAGTKPAFVLLAHMAVACFASMWISNVAAPVLMYSLIQPILRNLPSKSSFGPSLVMGIALASNIGGQTSPIASPQNLIALQYMPGEGIGWLQWFAITIPVSGLSLLVIWILLLWAYGSGRGTVIKKINERTDKFSGIQYFISAVTIGTIVLWCVERNFEWVFGDMGVIAVLPMILFFGTGILTKEDFNNFLWTVVILAMGGIALGKAVTSSGLLESLDDLIQAMVKGMPIWQVLLSLLGISLVVATFISHTIAAVLLVPIASQVGDSLSTPHPKLLIMATALTASAACGLPVSGFPNMTAVSQVDSVGRRYVTAKDFIKVGVPASLAATLVIGTLGYLIMALLGL